jgi:competence protein ComEC
VIPVSATKQAQSTSPGHSVDMRLPLVAVVTWGVILVIFGLQPPGWLQGVAWLVAVAVALVFRGSRWLSQWTLALVLAGIGAGSLALHTELRSPDVLTSVSGQAVNITVELTQALTPGAAHINGLLREVNGAPVSRIPTMVFIPAATERLALGTRVATVAELRPVDKWDSRGWIGTAWEFQVVATAPAMFAQADALREKFLTRSLARGGDAGALLPGLSLGDTTGVPDDLERAMRRSALAHLVAVSGANCALVVGIAVWVTALLGGSVRARLLAGGTALIGFVILVTPEPSVIRAAVMAVIVLFAMAIGRPFRGLPVLGMTVWVLLLIDPWRSVELAFVLSVAATAGILLGYARLARVLERIMPKPLAWFVALPLSAQLAVQPIIILLRPTLPVWGIPANILAAPAAPLVTFLGVVGAITGPLPDPVPEFFTWLGWFPAAWIAGIARAVSLAPLSEVSWIAGIPGMIALAIVTILALGAIRAKKSGVWLLGSAAVLIVGVVSQTLPGAVSTLRVPAGWSIAQCDVGQGDSVVYRTADTTVVIDTGDSEELMEKCLRLLRIRRVDYLVLTHFDRDHVGASAVFHGITGVVVTGPPENDEDRRRLGALAHFGATIQQVAEGDRRDLGGAVMEVMWPSRAPLAEPGNNSSVVSVFTPTAACATCLSMAALGDVGEMSQRMLMDRMAHVRVDVVKVSHHGSADQYSELYRQLGSGIALIGVGATNRYGHPAQSVLDFLDNQQQTVIRSDLHGTAVLTGTSDHHVRVWWSGER